MQNTDFLALLYLLPIAAILIWYWRRHVRLERISERALRRTIEADLGEPPTLHPDIDPTICIGCKACVAACPEQESGPVLGMIGKKARLIGPSHCIGHGACHASCPVDAITLVFGTATRGVDIPMVKPNFETNVPGIFIAGELGGMGLIRNAVEQGRQAAESIARLVKIKHQNQLDVLIVGAGPAGISASLGALENKLRYVTIEQDSLGGTVAHFPRHKIVMTQPAELPIVGTMQLREVSKEVLIGFWQKVERATGLSVNYNERLVSVHKNTGGSGFVVKTNRQSYITRALLLAIGRRGSPRRLGVPGEQLHKVSYHLVDPAEHKNQRVLVVGGGDSALEAAISLVNEPGTSVTLSYRSAVFKRARPKNREKIQALASAGKVDLILESVVREIHEDHITLSTTGRVFEIQNDWVIIAVGGELPEHLLREIGIAFETKFGTA